MIRADQQLLYQSTNQSILGIRQMEIHYYQSLNVAFGTQAALIGGFTYGVYTLNLINYDNGYVAEDVLADMYWILSAITIALSVHVILCTMLMQVLGPGLALNGPVGSMARATEGMRIEQKQVIIAFIAMMAMFAASTVLSCWVVMSFEAALGCTIAFIVAAGYWYYYCERIYLRFYWRDENAGWESSEERDSFDDLEAPPLKQQQQASQAKNLHPPKRRSLLGMLLGTSSTQDASNQHRQSTGGDGALETASNCSAGHSDVSRGTSKTFQLTSLFRSHSVNTMGDISDARSVHSSLHGEGVTSLSPRAPSPPDRRVVVMEGYMTKRGGSTQKRIDFRTEPWERRYFTLTNTCNLFIYKNRNAYHTDPKSPIFTRPLRLYEYYIEVFNMNQPTSNSLTLLEEDPANPYRFQMTLILRENVDNSEAAINAPLTLTADGRAISTTTNGSSGTSLMVTALQKAMYRDHWVLQCDTEEELLQWVSVMKELCPSCFREVVV